MRSWPQASAEVNRDKWLIIVLPVARRCRMAGSAASPQVPMGRHTFVGHSIRSDGSEEGRMACVSTIWADTPRTQSALEGAGVNSTKLTPPDVAEVPIG